MEVAPRYKLLQIVVLDILCKLLLCFFVQILQTVIQVKYVLQLIVEDHFYHNFCM